MEEGRLARHSEERLAIDHRARPRLGHQARLVAYTLDGDDKRVAENLFVPVKLTLKLKNGKQATKNVTYVIGTSPQVMVFRSLR